MKITQFTRWENSLETYPRNLHLKKKSIRVSMTWSSFTAESYLRSLLLWATLLCLLWLPRGPRRYAGSLFARARSYCCHPPPRSDLHSFRRLYFYTIRNPLGFRCSVSCGRPAFCMFSFFFFFFCRYDPFASLANVVFADPHRSP
jgi:hypothetical protein